MIVLGSKIHRTIFDTSDEIADAVEERRGLFFRGCGLRQRHLHLRAVGDFHLGGQRDRVVVDFRGDRHGDGKVAAISESGKVDGALRRAMRKPSAERALPSAPAPAVEKMGAAPSVFSWRGGARPFAGNRLSAPANPLLEVLPCVSC